VLNLRVELEQGFETGWVLIGGPRRCQESFDVVRRLKITPKMVRFFHSQGACWIAGVGAIASRTRLKTGVSRATLDAVDGAIGLDTAHSYAIRIQAGTVWFIASMLKGKTRHQWPLQVLVAGCWDATFRILRKRASSVILVLALLF